MLQRSKRKIIKKKICSECINATETKKDTLCTKCKEKLVVQRLVEIGFI